MNREAHSPQDQLPEADQMLAMAFADGELRGEALEAFTQRIAREPALARAVDEFRRLELLTRQLSPPEPRDLVWREHASGELHRLLMFGSYVCLILAASIGALLILCAALGWRIPAGPQVASALAVLGLLQMLFASLRWRKAERGHDPYVHVQR